MGCPPPFLGGWMEGPWQVAGGRKRARRAEPTARAGAGGVAYGGGGGGGAASGTGGGFSAGPGGSRAARPGPGPRFLGEWLGRSFRPSPIQGQGLVAWDCPACRLRGNFPSREVCRACGYRPTAAEWAAAQSGGAGSAARLRRGASGGPVPGAAAGPKAGAAASPGAGAADRALAPTGPPAPSCAPHQAAQAAMVRRLAKEARAAGLGGIADRLEEEAASLMKCHEEKKPLADRLKLAEDKAEAKSRALDKAKARMEAAEAALEKAKEAVAAASLELTDAEAQVKSIICLITVRGPLAAPQDSEDEEEDEDSGRTGGPRTPEEDDSGNAAMEDEDELDLGKLSTAETELLKHTLLRARRSAARGSRPALGSGPAAEERKRSPGRRSRSPLRNPAAGGEAEG